MYMIYTFYRVDPNTGEKIAIDLDVELSLGEVRRADNGAPVDLTPEEFDRLKEGIWGMVWDFPRDLFE